MEIDLYHRNGLDGAGDTIELKSVSLVFPIKEVFTNIVFDAA